MSRVDLAKILEESGAILHGHFKLTSGRHSDVYFEKFRILEQPAVLSALAEEIAEQVKHLHIDLVAGPTTGGIIIAFEVGRILGVPTRYVETENGVKTLRRNATLPVGARVLVVDDVLTTGLSLEESRQAIESRGANVVAFGVLINRSDSFKPDVPLVHAYKVEAISYAEAEIPDWLSAIPITKPGTRATAAAN